MSEFDERMLFEPIDGEPDPAFEAALLLRLYDELSSPTSHPSTETDPGFVPDPEVEIVMLKPNDLEGQPTERRAPRLALVAAAAVLIVGVIALWPSDDPPVVTDRPEDGEPDGDTATTEEVSAAVGVAQAFMEGRAGHDGQAIRALVSDDATISFREEWISDPDEYPGLIAWEEIAGVTFEDIACSDGSPGRVRCTYVMSTAMARALGYDGWPNSFVLDVGGGVVTNVTHNRTEQLNVRDSYYVAVFSSQFGPWVDNNSAAEWETMTRVNPSQPFEKRSPAFTPEALELWAARIPEFIAHVEAERLALANEFMAARIAGDADAVRATLSPDVEIVERGEEIADSADYEAMMRWERAEGARFDDHECDASSTRVLCEYTMSTAVSEAVGAGPWRRNFQLDVQGGLIVGVIHNRYEIPLDIPGNYVATVNPQLTIWLDDNHPGDWEVMTDPNDFGPSMPAFTDESLALWEIRIPEFIASLQDG